MLTNQQSCNLDILDTIPPTIPVEVARVRQRMVEVRLVELRPAGRVLEVYIIEWRQVPTWAAGCGNVSTSKDVLAA